jgi:6-phosphogluconolactonase
MIYKLESGSAKLTPNDPPFATVPPGSGPRHFAFHPAGKFAYAINEMLCTVTAFSYDARAGALKPIQTVSTLPEGIAVLPGYSTAEVQVHPNGRFLYGSNRGHDTIAVFAIDREKGTLKLVGNEPSGGKIPRNFGIDPTGKWLLAANEKSDNVVVFSIDYATGGLKPAGQAIEIGAPVCVKFMLADQ